jgi:hypothetical protein
LTDAIEVSLDPLALADADAPPIDEWSDEQVLLAVDAIMPAEKDHRLAELLSGQKAGEFTSEEQAELRVLMQSYQQGQLQKARALGEAVRRGLRPAPMP